MAQRGHPCSHVGSKAPINRAHRGSQQARRLPHTMDIRTVQVMSRGSAIPESLRKLLLCKVPALPRTQTQESRRVVCKVSAASQARGPDRAERFRLDIGTRPAAKEVVSRT